MAEDILLNFKEHLNENISNGVMWRNMSKTPDLHSLSHPSLCYP